MRSLKPSSDPITVKILAYLDSNWVEIWTFLSFNLLLKLVIKYARFMQSLLTILTSAIHTSLVKTFSSPKLAEQPFAVGKDFKVTEKPVYDLQSLSKVLQRLENSSKETIIRGSLTKGQTNPVPRNKETFSATPRQWCMIDIDSLAWDGDINDQKAILAHAIQQLPAEFQSVDYWLSSPLHSSIDFCFL